MKTICTYAAFPLILFFLGLPIYSVSQCNPVVSRNIYRLPYGVRDSMISSNRTSFLVCDNGALYYFGNNPDTVYLEGSARLEIGWATNLTIYMKNNSMLDIDTSTGGIYLIGKIYYDPQFTMFTDTAFATIGSITSCSSQNYDYSNFPGAVNPCQAGTSIESGEPGNKGLLAGPVPASDFLQLSSEWLLDPTCSISILDMNGKSIFVRNSTGEETLTISLPFHEYGIYALVLRKGDQFIAKTILLE